ncbi:MAG: Maf family protein [Chitinophagales bacterium]
MERKIILASKSPRRYELMKMAGFNFVVDSKNVEEIHPQGVPVELIPEYLAKEKANAFKAELKENEVVIGADTIVLLNGKIYEKPIDRDDAVAMLMDLSGNKHEVITGVCLLTTKTEVVFSEKTAVFFNPLSRREIEYYVDTYKPFDKAGSYACQEWIGAVGIKRFEGDYFNVVGLPVNRVYAELKKLL